MAHHFRERQLNLRPVFSLCNLRVLRTGQKALCRRVIPLLLIVLPLGLLPDKSWEVVAGQRLSLNAIPWEIQYEAASTPDAVSANDAESLLREAHRLLSVGQRAEALSISQELVARYPSFQLGQLLFADLLNLMSQAPIDPLVVLNDGG